MTVTEAIRQRLEQRADTLYRVAKDSGVSWATLNRFLNGGKISGEVVDKLCDYFGAELTFPKKAKGK